MRIISGTAKGTKLYTLDGLTTRPTLDRVKESLFNIIYDKIEDSVVLDLFSGSGAIGLEFASRGAKKVYLCDKSKEACKIIEKNIEKTHLAERVELFNMDFLNTIKKLENKKVDIVYLDPPYKTDFIEMAIKELIKANILEENTIMIAETDEKDRIIKNIEEIKEIQIIDQRKYGRANILFLERMKKRKGRISQWRYSHY